MKLSNKIILFVFVSEIKASNCVKIRSEYYPDIYY